MGDMELLRRALRLTREYVGERALPAAPGWEWYEAVKATGGFDGFGRCGCVLDPQVHGRPRAGDLFYCTLAAGHEGDHAPSAPLQTGGRKGERAPLRWMRTPNLGRL